MTEYAKCKHGILAFQFCGACRQDTDARVQQLQHENSVLMQSRRELIRVNDDLRDQLADAEKALAQERARADMAAMRLREAIEGDTLTAKRVYKLLEQRDELAAALDEARAESERISKIVTDNAIQYAKELADAFSERDRLRAENEKLVKALNEIAAWDFHAEGPQAGSQAWSMRIARKALADAGRGREG